MKRILNTLQTIAKYGALLGVGFYVFFCSSAVKAKTLNPDAGLLDITGQFYETMAETAVHTFIPGAGIILHEIFRLATDIILPGTGTALTAVFNTISPADALGFSLPTPNP